MCAATSLIDQPAQTVGADQPSRGRLLRSSTSSRRSGTKRSATMTGAFSLMVSQYPQSRAIAQLATGFEVECQDEYGSTRPPSTENYQIAWVTFASVAPRCRTSSLREAVTAWRGTSRVVVAPS